MLNLEKLEKRKTLVLDKIESKTSRRDLKANIVFALDYSGSMRSLYKNGTVQETVERILAVGTAIDPDGEVDLFLFHHGVIAKKPITITNGEGYVDSFYDASDLGRTKYAPIINAIVEKYKPKVEKKGGMFGFGGTEVVVPLKYPIMVIFITDGENEDKADAKKAITEASKYGIFFQFVGIGDEDFVFLQKLDDLSGRTLDNADFFKVEDLTRISDEKLFDYLFNEFPGWFDKALTLNMFVKQ